MSTATKSSKKPKAPVRAEWCRLAGNLIVAFQANLVRSANSDSAGYLIADDGSTSCCAVAAQHPSGQLWVIRSERELDGNGHVVLAIKGARRILFDRWPLPGIAEFLRRHVAAMAVACREAFQLAVLRAAAEVQQTPKRLCDELRVIRDILREQLPSSAIEVGRGVVGSFDSVHEIDAKHFVIQGWVASPTSRLTSVIVVSPEGCRIELLPSIAWMRRTDLDQIYGALSPDGTPNKLGFLVHVSIPIPSRVCAGWLVEFRNEDGDACEASGPLPRQDVASLQGMLLSEAAACVPENVRLLEKHLHPALQRLQARKLQSVCIDRALDFGRRPSSPAASILIPLYNRVDFIEHQLAAFSSDPELHQAELIYVLDYPPLSSATINYAAMLSELYDLPFRLLTLTGNGGYSHANNLAAQEAGSELLLLLNPDVLPASNGWLSKLSAFHRSRPDAGAVGPLLLYEDDTIQHAGMFFARDHATETWWNHHLCKGMHCSVDDARRSRPVPAVTGAALLIEKCLYHQVGGLSEQYVIGDYEDSDLCVKLIGAGRTNWFCSDVALYHLEGMSYPTRVRRQTSAYNRWLHSHRFAGQLAKVTATFNRSLPVAAAPNIGALAELSRRVP